MVFGTASARIMPERFEGVNTRAARGLARAAKAAFRTECDPGKEAK